MTDEPSKDRGDDLPDKALNDEPNRETGPDEPGAKTSSGDKEHVTPPDDDQ